MGDGWVALDKSLARTMKEIDRPFSYVEAMFSHSINVNCGRPWSIKGYAESWQWDRKKVRKFIEEIPTEDGYGACKRGMSSGYKIRLIDLKLNGTEQGHNRDTIGTEQGHHATNENNSLHDNRDTIGTEQGHNRDTMRDPIIKNNKKNKKDIKEKDTRFDARLFLSERGVLDQHITDWFQIRKAKKAPPTLTALESVEKEATKAGVTLATAVQTCCEKGWVGFNSEWVNNGGQNGKSRTATGKGNGFAEARKSGETNWLE